MCKNYKTRSENLQLKMKMLAKNNTSQPFDVGSKFRVSNNKNNMMNNSNDDESIKR